MKNNYFIKQNQKQLFALNKAFLSVFVALVLMLFANLEVSAQACNPKLRVTITTEDATTSTASNAKIRVSGLPGLDYKLNFSTGSSFGTPLLGTNTAYSALTSGYLSQALATPAAAPGDQYTIRIFRNDESCYTDTTITLPYVHFEEAPTYADIEVTIAKNPTGDVALDSYVDVYFSVRNTGTQNATGVAVTVSAALGLTYVSDSLGLGAYSNGTGIWTLGNLNMGQTVLLKVRYQVTARGVKEIKAWNSALNQIDIDSDPATNATIQDDQGYSCVSTYQDWCTADEYTVSLLDYSGIQWFMNGNPISGNTANYEVTVAGPLIIKGVGVFSYTMNYGGSCPATGCCPIEVRPGLPPDQAAITDKFICFGDAIPRVASGNLENGPFLSDQGVYNWQWFNNNGANNPGSAAIAGQTDSVLTALPTAIGVYNYKLVARQTNHTSCADSVNVSITINEIPLPVATVNSPVCQEDTIFLRVTSNAIAGLNYSWAGPSSYASAVQNPQILDAQASKAGDYVVTLSYAAVGATCLNRDTVNLVVNPIPAPPNAIDTVYCQDIVAVRMSALATGDSLGWYPNTYFYGQTAAVYSQVGRNRGPIPNTHNAQTLRYFVTQFDANRCESHPDTLDVRIDPRPIRPVVADLAYCENYTTDPLAATRIDNNNYILRWYNPTGAALPTGDTLVVAQQAATAIANNDYIAPPNAPVGLQFYYVSQFNTTTGCESDKSRIQVDIKDTPNVPVVSDIVQCQDDTPTALAYTADPGNTIMWYWNGASQAAAPVPPTTIPGGTYAYVTQTSAYTRPDGTPLACESPQDPILVTINPKPVADLITVSSTCIGLASQNNGQLILTRYRDSDVVSWNAGSTYGAATPSAFATPLTGGVFATSLANPATTTPQPYTVRVRNSFGCQIDVTENLVGRDCLCPGGFCEPATVTKTR
jgi:hypothetical protein